MNTGVWFAHDSAHKSSPGYAQALRQSGVVYSQGLSGTDKEAAEKVVFETNCILQGLKPNTF